jgi:hypothetical protein
MRAHPLLLLFLLTALPAHAAPAPHWLVRYHVGAWRPAALPLTPGLRFDPESGEAIVEKGAPVALVAAAEARARAEASVVRAADGSRHARTPGAFRRYTVVSTASDGTLQQDCVHSAAEAEAIIRAAAAKEQK